MRGVPEACLTDCETQISKKNTLNTLKGTIGAL